MAPLKSLSNPEIQPLIASFNTILSNISNNTEKNIQKGNFSAAIIGINQLEKMEGFIQPLVDFLKQYSENSQNIMKAIQDVKENAEGLLKSLDEIQNQLSP
jgi:methyl-accepting chemotaxis protein